MNTKILPSILGVSTAVAITTVLDAAGYASVSAVPLLPLGALFWYLQKFSRQDIGLAWGNLHAYGIALAYPVLVMGLIILIALANNAIDTGNADWSKTLINVSLMSTLGAIALLLTEEGFFRGWLWAALKKAKQTDFWVLVWSSVAFMIWHISAVSLDTGFDLPANEIPIYLINGTFIGAVFGMLRMACNSIIVPSVCHAVWNGLDYPLFGFGEKMGALGIHKTHIYGPEVGILSIVLNAAFASALFYGLTRKRKL